MNVGLFVALGVVVGVGLTALLIVDIASSRAHKRRLQRQADRKAR